jgi:eukaryotic-like serine/threonine-protein kinase
MSIPAINDIFATHYLLKELLASRRVEELWKAEDWSANGELVTVRLFAPQIRLDHHTLEMLTKENEAREVLSNRYLLLPHRFGVYEGIPYQVMPYMADGSLSNDLLTNGPLSERDVALLLSQVGNALEYLHTHQPPLLHRRISTDTILLAEDDSFLLSAPALSSQLRTVLHNATGTPLSADMAYAAPELFGAHPVQSEASDIFALGVTLYQVCTGELPWLGNGGLSLSQGAEVPYLPGPYSRILSNLVRACLHPEPEKRPSASVLVDEASYFLEHGTWKPYGAFGNVTAESIVYKKRSPWLPVLLVTILLLGAAAAAYFFLFRDKGIFDRGGLGSQPAETVIAPTTDTSVATATPAVQPEAKQPVLKTDTQQPAPKTAVAPTQAAKRPATPPPARTAYPRPTTLDGYLNGLLNDEIPLSVRDQWRPAIRKYFTPDAIVYAKMNDAPLGSFGLMEFLDILLSTESANSIIIDEIIREENGPIDEISISIVTVK